MPEYNKDEPQGTELDREDRDKKEKINNMQILKGRRKIVKFFFLFFRSGLTSLQGTWSNYELQIKSY